MFNKIGFIISLFEKCFYILHKFNFSKLRINLDCLLLLYDEHYLVLYLVQYILLLIFFISESLRDMVDMWTQIPGIMRTRPVGRRERRVIISLRLASQLYTGLVLVYSRQVHHLLRTPLFTIDS